jgi:antitoxin component of RelBE/YafQ-DinJ toxin-antitoxin module
MKKQEYLQVRVDSAEKEAFTDAANLSGLALSAWVRERLRQNAVRELEAASQSVAFLTKKRTKEK